MLKNRLPFVDVTVDIDPSKWIAFTDVQKYLTEILRNKRGSETDTLPFVMVFHPSESICITITALVEIVTFDEYTKFAEFISKCKAKINVFKGDTWKMNKDKKGINEDDDFMKNILKSVDTEKSSIDLVTYRDELKTFIREFSDCEYGVSANATVLRSYLQQACATLFTNPEDKNETMFLGDEKRKINVKLLPKIISAWLDIIKSKPDSVDSYTFNNFVHDWLVRKEPVPLFSNAKTYILGGMYKTVWTVDKLLKNVLYGGVLAYGFHDFPINIIEQTVYEHDMLLDNLCTVIAKYGNSDPDLCNSEVKIIYDKYLPLQIWGFDDDDLAYENGEALENNLLKAIKETIRK